jgi:pimeloyl-ACP methyl ester carboxylesterase
MIDQSDVFPDTWIFLRGLTRSSFHWLGFEKKFKEHFRLEQVLTPDLAGNGVLYEEISNTNIDLAVEQIRSTIPENILSTKKVGVFAISMGAMVGTRWAEMYPNEISHLILVNSSFSSLSPFYKRLQAKNYPRLIRNFIWATPEKIERFIMTTTSNFEEKWKPYFSEIVEFHKKHPVTLANFIRQLKMAGKANFFQKPRAQVLILASKNDRLVHYSCSQDIAKCWQAVKIEIHPTAGHDLPLDAPEWILEQTSDWSISNRVS